MYKHIREVWFMENNGLAAMTEYALSTYAAMASLLYFFFKLKKW